MTRSTIICVDDDKWMLDVLSNLLIEWMGNNYAIEKASSGQEAVELIDECLADGTEISLLISDYIMPGMKGDELLELVKLKTPQTRRIMLTGFAAVEGIKNAINKAGIYRFMSKPWDNKDMMMTVLQAVRSYEQDKRAEKLASSHKELYHRFHGLTLNLQKELGEIVGVLAVVQEMGGGVLPGHTKRVAEYVKRICKRLPMTDEDAKTLETAAYLHDVGVIGLPEDEVKNFRGLSGYTHHEVARRKSERAKLMMAAVDDEKAVKAVMYHMERVDGKGAYALARADIPTESLIIGLCDYYDILSVTGPNDKPSVVLSGMSPYRGTIFDEKLFDIFMQELA